MHQWHEKMALEDRETGREEMKTPAAGPCQPRHLRHDTVQIVNMFQDVVGNDHVEITIGEIRFRLFSQGPQMIRCVPALIAEISSRLGNRVGIDINTKGIRAPAQKISHQASPAASPIKNAQILEACGFICPFTDCIAQDFGMRGIIVDVIGGKHVMLRHYASVSPSLRLRRCCTMSKSSSESISNALS